MPKKVMEKPNDDRLSTWEKVKIMVDPRIDLVDKGPAMKERADAIEAQKKAQEALEEERRRAGKKARKENGY